MYDHVLRLEVVPELRVRSEAFVPHFEVDVRLEDGYGGARVCVRGGMGASETRRSLELRT